VVDAAAATRAALASTAVALGLIGELLRRTIPTDRPATSFPTPSPTRKAVQRNHNSDGPKIAPIPRDDVKKSSNAPSMGARRVNDLARARRRRRDVPSTIPREDIDDVIGKASETARQEGDKAPWAQGNRRRSRCAGPGHRAGRRGLKRPAVAAQIAEQRRKRLMQSITRRLRLVVIWGVLGANSLKSDLNEIEEQRAQVARVVERQAGVQELLANEPSSLDRNAELLGAENRVRIEQQRYDEAASAYNARVDGFPNNLWRALFGLPNHVPLSNEGGLIEASP
jgi:hypothetical protein